MAVCWFPIRMLGACKPSNFLRLLEADKFQNTSVINRVQPTGKQCSGTVTPCTYSVVTNISASPPPYKMTINLFCSTQVCTFTRTARADGRTFTVELFSCDKRFWKFQESSNSIRHPQPWGSRGSGKGGGYPNVQNPKILLAPFGLNFILLTDGILPYSCYDLWE